MNHSIESQADESRADESGSDESRPIESRARFDLVRYANCWEDADILCTALVPQPGKRLLSIGSAGDNAFALLAGGAEVVAVDLSSAQLACIELRRAAFRNLDHAEVLKFLGVRPAEDRWATWLCLRKDLPQQSRSFWEQRSDSIRNGFIHDGKFEKYFYKFRTYLLPMIHRRSTTQQWLVPQTRDERLTFYKQRWNNWRWRLLFRVFFSRFVMGRLGRDPEFFRYVEGSVGERILARTEYALTELGTHDNPYLAYILSGNYGDALPRYLRPENFEAIRAGLDRLHVIQGPIDEVAMSWSQRPADGFDGYNLSDIFEYMSPELSSRVYGSLLRAARPKARLAYWNMLVPRSAPPEFSARVSTLSDLSRSLFLQDKAWFYSAFVVDEVRSSGVR
ncbi:MAG: DUF3419 family protein [Planctomycetaceae bacterium]|nr:DUF3419 family protein [Planctomycetaceae bacterium]